MYTHLSMFGDNHISKGLRLPLRMNYWRKVIGNHKVVLTSIGMRCLQKLGRNVRPTSVNQKGFKPR